MKDPRKVVLAAGLNSMIGSYNKAHKEVCREYIKENLEELPDIFDDLNDQVLLRVLKEHKGSLKNWLNSTKED